MASLRLQLAVGGTIASALGIGAAVCAEPEGLDPSKSCPTGLPGGRSQRGLAADQNEQRAIIAAERDARARLESLICNGDSDVRCAYFRRFMERESQAWSPKGGQACAVVSIHQSILDEYEADTRQLKDDVAALATAVAARAGDHGIYLDDVTWRDGGCRAEEADYLVDLLRADLSAKGVPTLALEGDHLVPQLTWGTGADTRFALVDYRGEAIPNGAIEFGSAVLNLTDRTPCRDSASANGTPGVRVADDGLTVTVRFGSESASFCETDVISPIVETNRPAYVNLYAVDSGGLTYHVWPPKGASGFVRDRLVVPQTMRAWRTHGTEQLVVTAAVKAGNFGQTVGWSGFCRVAIPYTDALFPHDVAIGAVSYVVGGPGTPSCVRTPDVAESILNALVDAPVCGSP